MTHNPNLSFNMFDTRNPSFFQNSYLLLNLSNCSIWYGKKRTGDKQICARGTGAKGTSDRSLLMMVMNMNMRYKLYRKR